MQHISLLYNYHVKFIYNIQNGDHSPLGLGDTENVPCDNCNKRQCNYCGNIAVEYLRQ